MRKFQTKPVAGVAVLLAAVAFFCATARAQDAAATTGTNSLTAPDGRFGLFDELDHRSVYYQEFFPQPLLVDDTGLEQDGELESSYLHTQAGSQHTDIVTAGVQKSFGLLTVEVSLPYERDYEPDEITQGVGNLELGVRYPLYQWVSADDGFDTTLGVGLEAGLPVNSAVSKNTELTPELFNDLKLGTSFSLQSVFSYSTLYGGGGVGGLRTFEYGFALGYAVPQTKITLPGIERFTPLLELSGETDLNQASAGQNDLLGSIGFRLDFKAIGDVQPSLGLGYVLPVDNDARTEVHWGIATSLTLEF